MKDIGIRELKKEASALVRHLAKSHDSYTITRRGKAVAVLAPVRELDINPVSSNEAWARFENLSNRISSHAIRRSVVTELRNMRR